MEETALFWFSTPMIFIYLIIIAFIGIACLQWKWSKTAQNNVMVLVKRADGHGDYVLVPQKAGSVAMKEKQGDTIRLWPINEMSTIDVPYPGIGMIPLFLQKKIRMTIVDEEDWEPLLNRSIGKRLIASPAILGNLIHEKITESIITVNKEMMDNMNSMMRRMGVRLNPIVVYAGIGLVIILLGYIIFAVLPGLEDTGTAEQLEKIMQSLGIK